MDDKIAKEFSYVRVGMGDLLIVVVEIVENLEVVIEEKNSIISNLEAQVMELESQLARTSWDY